MTQPRLDFTRPAVRANDPDTSRAAWRSVEPRAGTMRSRILQLLRNVGPLTGSEIAWHVKNSHNNVSPRIAELAHAGFVEDSGQRRRGPDEHATQIVWKATSRSERAADGQEGGPAQE